MKASKHFKDMYHLCGWVLGSKIIKANLLDTILLRHLWFEVTTSEINHFTTMSTPCEVQEGDILQFMQLEYLYNRILCVIT